MRLSYVIVTDIPVFHEIAGGAALFVPTGDPAGYVAAVHALGAPEEWACRSAAAAARARACTWENSAHALLDLLRSLTSTAAGARLLPSSESGHAEASPRAITVGDT
jgi:glycosyltransferase involved in cell wall biosynthesis